MKKISERAIEIMVERHKRSPGPSQGFPSFHNFMTRTAHDYPSVTDIGLSDMAQALDEFQAGKLS